MRKHKGSPLQAEALGGQTALPAGCRGSEKSGAPGLAPRRAAEGRTRPSSPGGGEPCGGCGAGMGCDQSPPGRGLLDGPLWRWGAALEEGGFTAEGGDAGLASASQRGVRREGERSGRRGR